MSPQDSITKLLRDGIKGVEAWPDWMQQLIEKERVVKEIVNQQGSEEQRTVVTASRDVKTEEAE